ncbi:MAG: hypothetical protein ACYCV8_09935, partial [bacterium]
MKKKTVYFIVFSIVILTASCFKANSAYPLNLHIKSDSNYSAILKRLNFYKKDLAFLSDKISKKKKEINDLKNKIKNAENKIKNLKNKIKKDGRLIKGLTMRIFVIHTESGSSKLSSFKDGVDSFIINYQLKTLLQKEEMKLSKLVNRKNKFLKLKRFLKKEKNILVKAVKSINGTKIKLKDLIGGIDKYIKSVKIKHKHNKNNRLLKRKVIKLIHNLNEGSKKNDIKFI